MVYECNVIIRDIEIPLKTQRKLQKIKHIFNEEYHFRDGGGDAIRWYETKILEHDMDITGYKDSVNVKFGHNLSIQNLAVIEKILGQKMTELSSGDSGISAYFHLDRDSKRKRYAKNLEECLNTPNSNGMDVEILDRKKRRIG